MTMIGHFLDDVQRRENAVRLALYAVGHETGRRSGDPVHEEVTEGRYTQWKKAREAGLLWAARMVYSSCGDLVAWLLWRLGCRDESLVNRTGDDGQRAWIPGHNVSMVVGHRAYRRASSGGTPQPGDALFLRRGDGHLAVLIEWNEMDGVVVSADYGQPEGRRRVSKLVQRSGRWYLDGSELDGWLDLDAVTFEGPLDLSGVP